MPLGSSSDAPVMRPGPRAFAMRRCSGGFPVAGGALRFAPCRVISATPLIRHLLRTGNRKRVRKFLETNRAGRDEVAALPALLIDRRREGISLAGGSCAAGPECFPLGVSMESYGNEPDLRWLRRCIRQRWPSQYLLSCRGQGHDVPD